MTASSSTSTPAVLKGESNSTIDRALCLIAKETAIDISELQDDADFADLGIDSLMSLVLAEKFQSELNVKVNGSLFLDYPLISDLREWLELYYS